MTQEHRYHLSLRSSNRKLGPMPASSASRSTCPSACSFKAQGCYAEYGPLSLHWRRLDRGERGVDWLTFCAQVRSLPKYQLWRLNQAGDLPGDGVRIDAPALRLLVAANRGRYGFGFSHYDARDPHNAQVLAWANAQGLTLNLSAESLAHADALWATGAGPVVTLLPAGTTQGLQTPAGHEVLVCPASLDAQMTCARCALCAVATRKSIVGFPAHGSGQAKAQAVFFRRVD